MRLGFLTTGDPLYLPLFFNRALADCGAETVAVFSVPPLYRRQSRRQAFWRYFQTFGVWPCVWLASELALAKLRRQSIRSICANHGVQFAVVEDVNDGRFVSQVRDQRFDVLVSVSCPQIFGPELIAASRHGILNVHGALLPQYRGVLPSFWMLANQEPQAGVSVHFVSEKIDGGNLCGQQAFAIEPRETLHDFLRRSKIIAAELLLRVLQQLRDDALICCPIDLSAGSYYVWPTARDYRRFRSAGRRLF